MKAILVKPKNAAQKKALIDVFRKMDVYFETTSEPTNKEILASIQRGAREVELYLNGKIKLRPVQDFLNEL